MRPKSNNKEKQRNIGLKISPNILFLGILLLSSNIFLINQNTVLHVLEKVKKTKVKVLGEELNLSDGLVKVFFIIFHNFLLVH